MRILIYQNPRYAISDCQQLPKYIISRIINISFDYKWRIMRNVNVFTLLYLKLNETNFNNCIKINIVNCAQ